MISGLEYWYNKHISSYNNQFNIEETTKENLKEILEKNRYWVDGACKKGSSNINITTLEISDMFCFRNNQVKILGVMGIGKRYSEDGELDESFTRSHITYKDVKKIQVYAHV